MRCRRGFTLIELLVVIAIIAILAAILFPVFLRAKENARTAACLSNLRQIGMGVQFYSESWNGFCPTVGNIWMLNHPDYQGSIRSRTNLFKVLMPYTKNSVDVFRCKSRPARELSSELLNSKQGIWGVDGGKWKWTTYTTCAWIVEKGSNGTYWAHLPMFIDEGGKSEAVNLDSFDYRGRLSSTRTQTIIVACIASGWKFWSTGRFPNDHVPGNHGGNGDRALVLFADNHAQSVAWNVVGYF